MAGCYCCCCGWQEERRQTKATRARQLGEKQDVQIAHNMQFAEFNAAWDKYMQEYDQMAQVWAIARAVLQ